MSASVNRAICGKDVGGRPCGETPLHCGPCAPASRKDDAGKPRWSLLPFPALARVVDVLEFGAKKYAPHAWQKVENGSERYFDACLRHLAAYRIGEDVDPESGLPHLAHAACCILFMLALGQEDGLE